MSVSSTNMSVQTAINEFNILKNAALEAGRTDNDVIQFKFGEGDRVISADRSLTDKVRGFGWTLLHPFHKRSQDDVNENNKTRDKLVDLLVKICGVKHKSWQKPIDALPKSIRDVLKTDDFDGKGRPLSVRRIKAVAAALQNHLPGGKTDDFTPFGTPGGKSPAQEYTPNGMPFVKTGGPKQEYTPQNPTFGTPFSSSLEGTPIGESLEEQSVNTSQVGASGKLKKGGAPVPKNGYPEFKTLIHNITVGVDSLIRHYGDLTPDNEKELKKTLVSYRNIVKMLDDEIEKAEKNDEKKAQYLKDFKDIQDKKFWEARLNYHAKSVIGRAEYGDLNSATKALRRKLDNVHSRFEEGEKIDELVSTERKLVWKLANDYLSLKN